MTQTATLDLVAQMVRAALLDPHSPESANRLGVSVRKLKAANIDIHDLRLGTDAPPLPDRRLSFDEYEEKLAYAELKARDAQRRYQQAERRLQDFADYGNLKRKLATMHATTKKLRKRVKELETAARISPPADITETVERLQRENAALKQKLIDATPLRDTIMRAMHHAYRTTRDIIARMDVTVDDRDAVKELNAMLLDGLVERSTGRSHWRLKSTDG